MRRTILNAVVRNTTEYREAAIRVRSERGYPTSFLETPRKGELSCDDIKKVAVRLAEKEAPCLLDDAQTRSLEKQIGDCPTKRYPEEARWLRSQRRRFGASPRARQDRRH